MEIRKLAVLLVALLGAVGTSASGGTEGRQAKAAPFDYAPWERVLKKFVTETGRVDYAALKAASADLDRFAAELAARSPVSHPQDFPTRESQLAYWINTYNALAIRGVIEAWPVKSVLDIGLLPHSFFWRKSFTVGGRPMTLDNIENDFLRKQFAEPRIHFAIVCASNSCPRLQRQAYTAENVERLLEENARFYVNEPRNLRIDPARNRVTLAHLYTFPRYRGDFENHVRAKNISGTGNLLLDYVRLYTNPANRAALDALKNPRVEHFDYDWGINDVHAPAVTRENQPAAARQEFRELAAELPENAVFTRELAKPERSPGAVASDP